MSIADIAHDEPLNVDADWTRAQSMLTDAFTIRGLFVSPVAALIPDADWATLTPKLEKIPSSRSFIGFKFYLQRDYHKIVLAAAHARRRTDESVAQSIRAVARDDFHKFGSSTFGKVVMAVVGDARSALLKTPSVYDIVAPGSKEARVEAASTTDGALALSFRKFPINWPYQLGQVEGMLLHFKERARVAVDELDDGFRFVVRWT